MLLAQMILDQPFAWPATTGTKKIEYPHIMCRSAAFQHTIDLGKEQMHQISHMPCSATPRALVPLSWMTLADAA